MKTKVLKQGADKLYMKGGNNMYALYEGKYRISEYMSLSDIVIKYGDIKELESSGFRVIKKGSN